MHKSTILQKLLLPLGLTLLAGGALAQDFPSKPLKIVVPFPAGGGSDIVARLIAKGMQARLGQAVVIDNKGGAGTVIGSELVARSPGDGYTLLWAATPMAINAALLPKLPYDTLKDFTMAVDIVAGPLALAVNSNSPWNSAQDLIADAKRRPGKISFGSSGNGGSPHLASEMLRLAGGVQMMHVPYRGSAPALNDLLANQTSFQFDTITILAPHAQSGKVRILATSGRTRSSVLPNVPTVAESGFPGFEATSWMSLAVPASTPRDVVRKINAAVVDSLKDPEIRAGLSSQGWEIVGNSPEDSATRLRGEVDRWVKVVREASIKAD